MPSEVGTKHWIRSGNTTLFLHMRRDKVVKITRKLSKLMKYPTSMKYPTIPAYAQ